MDEVFDSLILLKQRFFYSRQWFNDLSLLESHHNLKFLIIQIDSIASSLLSYSKAIDDLVLEAIPLSRLAETNQNEVKTCIYNLKQKMELDMVMRSISNKKKLVKTLIDEYKTFDKLQLKVARSQRKYMAAIDRFNFSIPKLVSMFTGGNLAEQRVHKRDEMRNFYDDKVKSFKNRLRVVFGTDVFDNNGQIRAGGYLLRSEISTYMVIQSERLVDILKLIKGTPSSRVIEGLWKDLTVKMDLMVHNSLAKHKEKSRKFYEEMFMKLKGQQKGQISAMNETYSQKMALFFPQYTLEDLIRPLRKRETETNTVIKEFVKLNQDSIVPYGYTDTTYEEVEPEPYEQDGIRVGSRKNNERSANKVSFGSNLVVGRQKKRDSLRRSDDNSSRGSSFSDDSYSGYGRGWSDVDDIDASHIVRS